MDARGRTLRGCAHSFRTFNQLRSTDKNGQDVRHDECSVAWMRGVNAQTFVVQSATVCSGALTSRKDTSRLGGVFLS